MIWDRAGGPRWSVARAFLPGGFFKSSSSQVSAAGHFRRESEIRGSRSVIHGRARLLPKALREIGNWVAHKARGPTSVALQSRENELSFLVLDDARFQALVRSFGPTGGLVHSGGGRHAEMALGALVERDAAGVLTEGRRRGPVVLKILGLRSRSWDREFDVRCADVEKPSSARNPKDKPAWLSRNSTGRRAFSGDVDSPQQSKQLPRNDPPGPVVVSCGIPCGCVFRDSPSGSGARGDEDH